MYKCYLTVHHTNLNQLKLLNVHQKLKMYDTKITKCTPKCIIQKYTSSAMLWSTNKCVVVQNITILELFPGLTVFFFSG